MLLDFPSLFPSGLLGRSGFFFFLFFFLILLCSLKIQNPLKNKLSNQMIKAAPSAPGTPRCVFVVSVALRGGEAYVSGSDLSLSDASFLWVSCRSTVSLACHQMCHDIQTIKALESYIYAKLALYTVLFQAVGEKSFLWGINSQGFRSPRTRTSCLTLAVMRAAYLWTPPPLLPGNDYTLFWLISDAMGKLKNRHISKRCSRLFQPLGPIAAQSPPPSVVHAVPK